MNSCCPTCGRKLTIAKTSKPVATVNMADLTDTQLFAHYKKTALLGDVRFVLGKTLSADLRWSFEQLEHQIVGGLSRVDAYKQYVHLQAAWRYESNARDRALCIPAIGTSEWHQANKDAADSSYYADLGQTFISRNAVAA